MGAYPVQQSQVVVAAVEVGASLQQQLPQGLGTQRHHLVYDVYRHLKALRKNGVHRYRLKVHTLAVAHAHKRIYIHTGQCLIPLWYDMSVFRQF